MYYLLIYCYLTIHPQPYHLLISIHVVNKVGQGIEGRISVKSYKVAKYPAHALLTESEDVFHTDSNFRVLMVDGLLTFADFLLFEVFLNHAVFHIVLML